MANTQSAIKAARKAVRLTLRNKGAKTRIKTLHKAFDAAVKSGDAKAAKTTGIAYLSAMDRAVKSGVVHRNAASRAKSHAAKYVLAK
jgi:small subunit ribosomal protein S20